MSTFHENPSRECHKEPVDKILKEKFVLPDSHLKSSLSSDQKGALSSEENASIVSKLRNILSRVEEPQASSLPNQKERKDSLLENTRGVQDPSLLPDPTIVFQKYTEHCRKIIVSSNNQEEFVSKEEIFKLLKSVMTKDDPYFTKEEVLILIDGLLAQARPLISSGRPQLPDENPKKEAQEMDTPEIKRLEELIRSHRKDKEP